MRLEGLFQPICIERALCPFSLSGCGNELGQFSEVLGGCCEVEFIAGTTWATQSEPVEFENTLEMSE